MWTKKSAKKIRKQVRGCLQNLYESVAIHLKNTFGTLKTSTKVFSLIIICKVFDKTILYLEILDYVPRDLTILYLEIVDSKHKQVGGCLQNLCQSVAIHLNYVLLVLL